MIKQHLAMIMEREGAYAAAGTSQIYPDYAKDHHDQSLS